jgi:hypothetical protein
VVVDVLSFTTRVSISAAHSTVEPPSLDGWVSALGDSGVPCVAACLRNSAAVARWLATAGERIGILAVGEDDADGRWRPAYEDLLGAGRRRPQRERSTMRRDRWPSDWPDAGPVSSWPAAASTRT